MARKTLIPVQHASEGVEAPVDGNMLWHDGKEWKLKNTSGQPIPNIIVQNNLIFTGGWSITPSGSTLCFYYNGVLRIRFWNNGDIEAFSTP